jgi:hypothetical protein
MAPPDQPAANDRCRGLSVAVFHDDIAGVSALPARIQATARPIDDEKSDHAEGRETTKAAA